MSPTDISFCAIVRNGGSTLAACLESVAAIADEMIVVDIGSTDDSVEIARRFGATSLSVAWQGDFAAARNVYLKAATKPWILSLDSDEFLEKTERSVFQPVLARQPATAFAFKIRSYFRLDDPPWLVAPSAFGGELERGVGWARSYSVRLIPRRRDMAYHYPVHESLLPTLKRQRIPIARCPIPIHRTRALNDSVSRGATADLYRELGRKKLAQYPEYAGGYLELGRVFLHEGAIDEAESLFAQCLRLDPKLPSAYYYSATALHRAKRFDDAHRRLAQGLKRFPKHPDLLYARGLIELDCGNVIGALDDMSPVLRRMPYLMTTNY